MGTERGCPSCGKWWGIALMILMAGAMFAIGVMIHDSVSIQAMDDMAGRCNEQIAKCNEIVSKYNTCAQQNPMDDFDEVSLNLTWFNTSKGIDYD